MDETKKKKILELYGCDESISSYMVHSGTKVGNTTKSKLKEDLSVDGLEA